ncbi:hypothetical protein K402DRAFT_309529, partial [Aulographum hederae CBS 113979]
MADALCGPSNPLQNFQKQTSADRTLQQDRLRSRHTPSQNLRSQGPNQGILDPEFEAFQAGVPGSALQPDFQHPPHFFPSPAQAQVPSPLAGWANDFQRLQISSPRPASAQRQQGFASQTSSQNPLSSWHQDFMRQTSPAAEAPLQQPMHPMFSGMPSYNMGMPMEQPQFYEPETIAQGKQREVDTFEEAAFEQAFQEAQTGMMSDEPDQELQAETDAMAPPQHQSAEEEAVDQQGQGANDADELAKTARLLLDSVADNETEKFQQSAFLALMRKLRDKEVKVEGDKMVEVS